MNSIKRCVLSTVVLVLVSLPSCNLEAPPAELPVPTDNVVSYSRQVQPIFNSRCMECHVAGSFAGFLQLTANESYDMLVDQPSAERSDLVLVRPGDSTGSLLFQKVSSASPPSGGRMPLFGPPLTAQQIALIRDWIDQGALDN